NGVQISLPRAPAMDSIANCQSNCRGNGRLKPACKMICNAQLAASNALFLVALQNSVKRIANVFEFVFAFDHLQSRGFAAFFARARLPKLRIKVHVNVAAGVEEILYRLA